MRKLNFIVLLSMLMMSVIFANGVGPQVTFNDEGKTMPGIVADNRMVSVEEGVTSGAGLLLFNQNLSSSVIDGTSQNTSVFVMSDGSLAGEGLRLVGTNEVSANVEAEINKVEECFQRVSRIENAIMGVESAYADIKKFTNNGNRLVAKGTSTLNEEVEIVKLLENSDLSVNDKADLLKYSEVQAWICPNQIRSTLYRI